MEMPDGPPRIAPLPRDQWTGDVMEALNVLRPPDAVHVVEPKKGGPRARNALGTILRHPKLARAFHTFNGHIIFTNTLTARQRELIVLRVSVLRNATYEWLQHVIMAHDEDITDEEIARVADAPDAAGWSPVEGAMLRAVDELVEDAMISDETWALLSESLDDEQLLDLIFTVGTYDLLAMAFNSCKVEIDDDIKPKP
jgi:alkylhydroperoxidase family enzyme